MRLAAVAIFFSLLAAGCGKRPAASFVVPPPSPTCPRFEEPLSDSVACDPSKPGKPGLALCDRHIRTVLHYVCVAPAKKK